MNNIYKFVNKEIQRQNTKKIILNPDKKPERLTWGEWQLALKIIGIKNQNGNCSYCGVTIKNRHCELHHALLTRGDVVKNKQKNLIHHTYNCLVLHKNCHKNITKEKSAQLLFYLYGKSAKQWYDNFPTKWAKPNIFHLIERFLNVN